MRALVYCLRRRSWKLSLWSRTSHEGLYGGISSSMSFFSPAWWPSCRCSLCDRAPNVVPATSLNCTCFMFKCDSFTMSRACVCAQPHRVRMTHNLIVSYGLYRDMEVFVRSVPAAAAALHCSCQQHLFAQRPALIDHSEMTHFHSDDYINFLRIITPDNMHAHLRQLQRCRDT